MADPLARPMKWSKNFQIYVEKHNLYDVFQVSLNNNELLENRVFTFALLTQELLKEMIIAKPEDPLTFIREEVTRVAKGICNPRAFIVGPECK
jgi:hypothetical protein